MKNILVTGSRGFIGRNIKEGLQDTNYRILAPSSEELNLMDSQQVKQYIRSNCITDIIHSAVYNENRRMINRENEIYSNLTMFYNIISHSDQVDKIIYFGSGAEYDKRIDIRMVEEKEINKNLPFLNAYSISKYVMNREAQSSKNIYNLRLFGVFGKYEDWKTCFISNICCKAIFGLPLTIRKDCLFDYLCVNDLINPVKWILESKPMHHDYNLCSGRKIKLTEIAALVKEISGKDLNIKLLSDDINFEYTGNPERLKAECKNFTLTDFKRSIEELYQYYMDIKSKIDYDTLLNTK